MGRIIKVKFRNPKLEEEKRNVKELKALINKYIKADKEFVVKKIKKEQSNE